MQAQRPEKVRVRAMWGKVVARLNEDWSGPEALYLTLPGEAGYDIELLAGLGVITRMDNSKAIDPRDVSKVIAVERNLSSYTKLRENFPGLVVHEGTIESLASGATDMTVFPARRDKIRTHLRASVVNLDYNAPLELKSDETGLHYPQLSFVQKLAQLHANPPPAMDWTLFLTLNGLVTWDPSANRPVQEYLAENLQTYPTFADQCDTRIGTAMCDKLTSVPDVEFSALTEAEQQLIVSVFVPKKIATLVHNQGWGTRTFVNWRYGGDGESAPMCTWAIKFTWDVRSTYQSARVYTESIATLFESFGELSADGELVGSYDT
jgi:hypothetical protein